MWSYFNNDLYKACGSSCKERDSSRCQSSTCFKSTTKSKNRSRCVQTSSKQKSGNAEETEKWSVSQFPVEPEEGKARFHDFKLPMGLMHGIADLNFKYCTPIQQSYTPRCYCRKRYYRQGFHRHRKNVAVFLIGIFTRLIRNSRRNEKTELLGPSLLHQPESLLFRLQRMQEPLPSICPCVWQRPMVELTMSGSRKH